MAASNICIGSTKTSFLSISLSGVIEEEVATIIAVLSALAVGRLLSTVFPPEHRSNADDFVTISLSLSDVPIAVDTDEETNDIADESALAVDIAATDCGDMCAFGTNLTGLPTASELIGAFLLS